MFKVHSASVARKVTRKINPIQQQQCVQLILTDKSPITGKAQELDYNSVSKIRKFFSKIFGNVLECTPDSGYKRITRVTGRGIRKTEKKIYPGGDKYVVTQFEANGKTPKNRTVYAKDANGKDVVVKSAKYRNGELFYSYTANTDGTYKRVQHLANNMIHFDSGVVGKKGELISTFKTEFESTAANRRKIKPQRYTDGAILRVKAEDLMKFRNGVRRTSLGKKKMAKRRLAKHQQIATVQSQVISRMKKSNIGIFLIDSLDYKNFRATTLRSPRKEWAWQNLRNWGFNVSLPNGLNKGDVHDVYVLRSAEAMDAYTPNEISLKEAEKIANSEVKSYWNKIYESRNSQDTFEIETQYTIGGMRLPVGDSVPEIDPEYDTDFIAAADFLIHAKVNNYYTEYTKIIAKDLNLKLVEYQPKNAIEKSNAKAKFKAELRERIAAKAQAKNAQATAQ